MKRYLIDTRIILWLVYRPELISEKILLLLRESEIYVSTVSIWEISVKYRKGTLVLGSKKPNDISDLLEYKFKYNIIPLTKEVTSSFYQLAAMHHRDPFDRMLIWQALQEDFTFITADANIQKYQDIGLKWLWS